MEHNDYIISGGEEGKKRLGVLSDVLSHYTRSLLERDGAITGKHFLDLGCGGGNVALMAAGMVGDKGRVTAIDFDKEIISLVQKDAAAQGVINARFLAESAYDISFNNEFDIVYARFLLSHLKEPGKVLRNMLCGVKPGGRIIAEDVQFSGHFCHPENKAFESYLEYYTTAARSNDQNPEIGPALVELFRSAGIGDIKFDVIQPTFSNGPGKWMAYITMDKIKHMVIKQGVADEQTVDLVLQELEAFTSDEQTIISLPRIFRVWGIKL